MENKKLKHFDNFLKDTNIDKINGRDDDKIQFDEEEDGEEHGEEDDGLTPENLSGGNGLSCQQSESNKESMDRTDKLPTDMENIAGLKRKPEK